MFSVPVTLLIRTIWHYRKQNFVSFLKFCLSLICAINFLMIFVIPVIHPPFPWPWYESSTWAGSNITCGCKITWSTCPRDPQTPLLCSPSLRLNPSMRHSSVAWTLLCTALMAWVKGRCSTVQQWQYIVDMFVTTLLQARSGKQLNPSMDDINDLNGGYYYHAEVDHW